MVDLPWRSNSETGVDDVPETVADIEAAVTCEFQDGTLVVSESEVVIDRPSRSKFSDKRIPMTDVEGVTYAKRLVISYIQIEQRGFDNDGASRFSTPVDENTLHLGRGKRACAKRARDAVHSRLGVSDR
jgi:hypothetical protein